MEGPTPGQARTAKARAAAAKALTPEQRALRARTAAFALHAQGKTNTKAATAASVSRWERQVDPDGVLPPDVRAKRAAYARRSYMASLALKASRARSRSAVPIAVPEPA